ncbi:helix-turn-helix transcriptional regulator [Bradyrhizobium diazoefficiens]|nr:helix-turn-helix transcriptional regulator [Bradyrhizobium diazoefficiens]MBR0847100.1 helix-turn-helix transcriptional regulator [Bradyrhizobium diazoefficiens]
MGEYRYTESGLDNVLIEGMAVLVDDGGEKSVTIPNINGLHKVIALGIVRRKTSMSGKELRFLRTEMGMTQAKLAEVVHREPLTISRWERSEDTIDANAEALIRVCATQELGLPTDTKVTEISGWCIQGEAPPPLVIDGTDPSNYRLKKAA